MAGPSRGLCQASDKEIGGKEAKKPYTIVIEKAEKYFQFGTSDAFRGGIKETTALY